MLPTNLGTPPGSADKYELPDPGVKTLPRGPVPQSFELLGDHIDVFPRRQVPGRPQGASALEFGEYGRQQEEVVSNRAERGRRPARRQTGRLKADDEVVS